MAIKNAFKLTVVFFCTEHGTEPVRDWLKSLSADDRQKIGQDIKTVQIGWPLGMPLVRSLGDDLWEVRTNLDNRIARVIFFTWKNNMVLVHGFIKKTQQTLKQDLELAKKRKHFFLTL